MTNDLDLLEQFARQGSQDAFGELVRRHVNLVYSAALRQVHAPQLAEEVAQSVFIDLARGAEKLSRPTAGPPVLTAWLYTVTRRTAVDVIRKESRRQQREQAAMELQTMNVAANDWIHIEPMLDDAMSALDEDDRTAILLRYFENKNLREVGEQLRITDDAAQKRVSRAVEKMREFFSKRNVAVGASGLVVLLSANAVKAAPAGLILSATQLSPSAVTTMNAMKITFATKLKLAFVALILIGAATAWTVQYRHQARLEQENETLRQQVARLTAENAKLSDRLTAGDEAGKLSAAQFEELLKLRGEIGVLRRQLEAVQALTNANIAVIDARTNPAVVQIHIKARFIAVSGTLPEPAAGSGTLCGIFDWENTTNILQQLRLNGAETLAEPEVVTLSGRQTQMRVTQTISVMTNMSLQAENDSPTLVPQCETVETGPIFDMTPRLLPDGYTIELRALASVTDFLGYTPTTEAPLAYAAGGQTMSLPVLSPQFHVEQATNVVNLLDGQTMLLKLSGTQIPTDAMFVQPDGSKTNYSDKQILVFVTPCLVDAAGNRVHKDAGTYTNLPPQ